jgi:hypothetical protein
MYEHVAFATAGAEARASPDLMTGPRLRGPREAVWTFRRRPGILEGVKAGAVGLRRSAG